MLMHSPKIINPHLCLSLGDYMNSKNRHIGNNVRQARLDKNLTIAKLAELIDVSDSYLGTAERSTSGFSVDVIIRIAKALNVTTDSLLLENNPTPEPATNMETLLAILSNCTHNEIDLIIELVSTFKKRHFFKGSHQ